jgi:hypothetical protein
MRFFQQLPELPIAFEEEQPANNQQKDQKGKNREGNEHESASNENRINSIRACTRNDLSASDTANTVDSK